MTASHLTAWRHHLHQHPDLSGNEAWTANEVRNKLAGLHPDHLVTGLGGHGVLAQFNGTQAKCKILVRCELDALPITETGTPPYRSLREGYGHLCGHDGHMAIVMGVAEAAAQSRPQGYDLIVLFQPAEETGQGAAAVIDDPRFTPFRPDYSIALHNMPGLPLGQIQVRAGEFSCASRGLRVVFTGQTAHAAQPETGRSPGMAMAELIAAIPGLNTPAQPGALPTQMATLTHAQLGEPTFGVAPAHAEVWITLRSPTDVGMGALSNEAEQLAANLANTHGLIWSHSYHDVFSACENDPYVVAAIEDAAGKLGMDITPQPLPMRPSEDFGRFGHISRAAMFLLGSGETRPALHNPDYDFPDELILPGITMFREVCEKLCAKAS